MSPEPQPLVGRARVLREVCTRAQQGVGSVLTGPIGSGGTRLLGEAATALRRSGLQIARLPSPVPPSDAAFLALLDPLAAAAVESADPPRRPAALRAALASLDLRALLVDDVATVGEASTALLVHLARTGVALVLNASGRAPVPAALEPLAAEGRLVLAPLPPLSDAEVRELAEHLLLDPVDAELLQALADVSGGRPGTLAEVVRDAVGSRSVVRTDGLWHLAGPLPAPRSVRSEVRDRFSVLPPDQRGWVAAVAVAGEVAADLAPRIAGTAATEGALRAGWTVHDGGTVRISSVPARTAVTDSLEQRARVAVLRRLIAALDGVERPLRREEQVALLRWRIELGDPVDPAAVLDVAMRPGVDRATQELLLRAAADGGAPAHAALADHLRRTRRPGEALRLIQAALPGTTPPDERAQLVRVAALTTGVVQRRSAEALAALDAYLDEHDPATDLLAVRAALLLLEGRPQESRETAERVLADPGRSGFADAFSRLQAALSLRELGLLAESRAASARFAADGRTAPAFPDAGTLARWLPHELAVAVGLELADAEAALTALHREAAQRALERPPYAYTLGSIRIQQGDPLGAAQLLREADGGAGGWRDGWRPRILAELSIAQGLAGATAEAVATFDRLARAGCPPIQRGRLELAAAQLEAVRGDRERAAAIAAATADRGRSAGLRLDAFDAEFAAIRYGDPGAADRLLALGPDPAGEGRDAQRAAAAAIRAGDPAAIDAAAQRLWVLGQRLHAVEVASVAAEAGSEAAARRVVGWLARLPGLRLPTRLAGRPIGLTAREREVAHLAARGASDRTIAVQLGITVRTAQTHLARAFAKLGVHRRTELHGLVDDA